MSDYEITQADRERDRLIDECNGLLAEVARLRAQLEVERERGLEEARRLENEWDATLSEVAEMRARWESACSTVAAMHAAAVGSVRGPIRGVVEDVADLRSEVESLRVKAAPNSPYTVMFDGRTLCAVCASAEGPRAPASSKEGGT